MNKVLPFSLRPRQPSTRRHQFAALLVVILLASAATAALFFATSFADVTPPPTHTPTALPPAPPADATIDFVVSVDGVTLSEADFDQLLAIEYTLAALLGRDRPAPRATLEQWINRTLLRLSVPHSTSIADVDMPLEALLTSHRLHQDELWRALAVAGVDEANFRAYFAELLQAQRLAPTASLTDLQRAARISLGPRGAALFDEDAAPVATATPSPAPTMSATATATPPTMEVRGTAPGLLAPDFALPFLPADPSAAPAMLTSADLAGAPTVLSFWTTWCPYCRRQTPILVDAYQRYTDQGLRFVGVNVKEDAALVRAYVAENQIPYAIVLDGDGAVAEEFMVRGFPTTYFLDADGRVVARHVGQLTTELLDDYLSRFPEE